MISTVRSNMPPWPIERDEDRLPGELLLERWPGFSLRLDPAGYTWKALLGRASFTWDEFDGPFEVADLSNGKTHVVFRLKVEARGKTVGRRVNRSFRFLARGWDGYVDPSNFRMSADELAGLLNEWRAAYGKA